MTPELKDAIPTGIKVLEEEVDHIDSIIKTSSSERLTEHLQLKRVRLKVLITALKQSL